MGSVSATYDYSCERVTINSGQTTYATGGSWTIVVSGQDPGVPNWLSTAGRRRGLLWFPLVSTQRDTKAA